MANYNHSKTRRDRELEDAKECIWVHYDGCGPSGTPFEKYEARDRKDGLGPTGKCPEMYAYTDDTTSKWKVKGLGVTLTGKGYFIAMPNPADALVLLREKLEAGGGDED